MIYKRRQTNKEKIRRQTEMLNVIITYLRQRIIKDEKNKQSKNETTAFLVFQK